MKCRYCDAELKDGAKFCPNCGKEVIESNVCVSCGEQIKHGALFCPHCGANQHEEVKSEPIPEVEEIVEQPKESFDNCINCGEQIKTGASFCPHCDAEQPQEYIIEQTSSKKWLWAAMAVVILALIGGGVYFVTNGSFGSKTLAEAVDSDSINISEQGENGTEMPSLNTLSALFESLGKDNSSSLFSHHGFQLVDKKSKKEESDYEGDEHTTYTINKDSYKISYKLVNGDGYMKIECVYSPEDYGEPSMTILCDNATWDSMKEKADRILKVFSQNYYWLDGGFIGFEKKGIITLTLENSISWGDDEQSKELQVPTDKFVGKYYVGNGYFAGMGTSMAISFKENQRCTCYSDFNQNYPNKMFADGTYRLKDDYVIVTVKIDGEDWEYKFQIADGGRKIGYDYSAPNGGKMDMDFLTLEQVDVDAYSKATK